MLVDELGRASQAFLSPPISIAVGMPDEQAKFLVSYPSHHVLEFKSYVNLRGVLNLNG